MKIYFAGSIRGGRKDRDLYLQIINYLKNFGEVLTEHIGDKNLTSSGEEKINNQFIHDRDMDWLLESDLIIAEVTNPSLGVGYEIGRAIEHNKKIICLYRDIKNQKISAMIAGSNDLICLKYSNFNNLKNTISKYFK